MFFSIGSRFFYHMNFFRLAGDMVHLLSILCLLAYIAKSKSCSGISGRFQLLLLITFLARYFMQFTVPLISFYNTLMKIVFIQVTAATVHLIYKYRSSVDRNHDTFRVEIPLFFCLILALFHNEEMTVSEVSWAFSLYLEAVAVCPQLWMVYSAKCNSSPVLNWYLFGLVCYRALYIANWFYRYGLALVDSISLVSGSIQTLISLLTLFYSIYYRSRPSSPDSSVSSVPPSVSEKIEKSAANITYFDSINTELPLAPLNLPTEKFTAAVFTV